MVQGFVYKITDNTTNKFYIGSTMSCKGFNHRKSQHKNDYIRYTNGNLNYRSYFDILENDDYSYEIIYTIEDCNKSDLYDSECVGLNSYKSLYPELLVNKYLMKNRFQRIQEDCGWTI